MSAGATKLFLEPKYFPQGLQQRMPAGFRNIAAEGRDGAMEKLVLQQPKGPFDVGSVGFRQLAVKLREQPGDDDLAAGFELLGEPGDDGAVAAAVPVAEKALHLLGDDGFGGGDVLFAIFERLGTN